MKVEGKLSDPSLHLQENLGYTVAQSRCRSLQLRFECTGWATSAAVGNDAAAVDTRYVLVEDIKLAIIVRLKATA